MNTNYICAVSSTRLRYENQKPTISIDLSFAKNDEFKPNEEWYKNMKLEPSIFENEIHECYKKQTMAQIICDKILAKNTSFSNKQLNYE